MPSKGEKVKDYTLKERIGRGSYGEVWLAEKKIEFSDKGIQFALKFLAGEDGKGTDFTSVKQEVSAWIGASGHPNIISVTDAFMHDDFFVLVGQYADGGSLRDWLKANGNKAPSIQEAAKMMKGILNGLIHLHSKKITHRDLKPENILLRGGSPCITDFGVSRMLEKTGLHSTKMAGSPLYMSPEAFIGNKAPQTDIWSMGVMFQELLCGYFPFYAENLFALMDSIIKAEPKPLPGSIPKVFAEIVERALKKTISERYQTASEMLEAIEKGEKTLGTSTLKKDDGVSTIQDDDFDESKYQPQPPKPEPKPIKVTPKPKLKSESQKAKPFVSQQPQRPEPKPQPQPQPIQPTPKVAKPILTPQPPKVNKGLWLGVGGVGFLVVFILFYVIPLFRQEVNPNSPATNTPQTTNTGDKTHTANLPNGVKMEMVLIPAGKFEMGSNNGDDNEKPVHWVTISKPFYMGKFEVTQGQWKAVMGNNPSYFKNCDDCPVEGVSWYDAQEFIKKLNALNDGYVYRLPTEAEWEYACRAGTTTAFSFGDSLSSRQANFDGNYPYGNAPKGEYKGKTTPVGSYQPNAFGLYDMHGNVWEWVQDWYGAYSSNAVTNPTGASTGSDRVIRGGSWLYFAAYLRSAIRHVQFARPPRRPPRLPPCEDCLVMLCTFTALPLAGNYEGQ